MQLSKALHNFVEKSLQNAGIRATKINAVLDMTNSLLNDSGLTLTGIGRNLPGETDSKHKIKRVDRWLGNSSLHKESQNIYKAVFYDLLRQRKKLEILVDSSGCCNWTESCLRASLVYSGRSITIYQEVHSSKEQQKECVHKRFLKNLKNMVHKDCEVVIITDRGFGYSWFKMVRRLGWDFLGRSPSFVHYQLRDSDAWEPIRNLYMNSSNNQKYIGKALVGKSRKQRMEVFLYSYKGLPKNRRAHRTRNKPMYSCLNKQYREMNTTPWILITSLKETKGGNDNIVKIYAKRMQIEQNFRDDKNERWGFSMQFSRTKTPERINVLLMLVAIASFVLMLIGVASETLQLHKRFQANTVKTRRVLSLITLAKEVLRRIKNHLKLVDLIDALKKMGRGESYEFAT